MWLTKSSIKAFIGWPNVLNVLHFLVHIVTIYIIVLLMSVINKLIIITKIIVHLYKLCIFDFSSSQRFLLINLNYLSFIKQIKKLLDEFSWYG